MGSMIYEEADLHRRTGVELVLNFSDVLSFDIFKKEKALQVRINSSMIVSSLPYISSLLF